MDNKQMEQMAREHDMSGIDPQFAEEVAEAVAKGSVSAYQKIEKGVVNGYKKIETGVVTGYKKIENGVVNGYLKLQDGIVDGFGKLINKCVEVLFAREGESVEQAKARLSRKAPEVSEEAQAAEEAQAQE